MDQKKKPENPDSGEEPLRPIKPIPASKRQVFSVGNHKKTPFQKHKEETELKKKKETEEAAKVYEEFVASFADPPNYALGTKSFVKSQTMVPREVDSADYVAPTAKQTYKPMPFVKAGEGPKPKPKVVLKQEEESDEEDDMLARKEAKAMKKRNLDTFLEEIKKEQEDREDRLRAKVSKPTVPGGSSVVPDSAGLTLKAAFEDRPGSHDTGDPLTTNLYVGNINPAVKEPTICQEFAKYGPIASVKIMWPRTKEERDRNRNCGFVSFMNRKDAEQALKALDGKDFQGYIMKVGWGKALPLPSQPIFVLDNQSKPVQTGLPFNAQVVHTQGSSAKPRAQIVVVKPANIQQVKAIHRVVERVAKYGPMIESEEHVYYRWRLYSILQGDTKSQWRTEPFQMFEEGPWWVPPDIPFDDEGMMDVTLDSEDEDKEQVREGLPKGTLGKISKQRFEVMLRQVTFQRGTIAQAMAFAIDHADAADEVIDIICKSLVIPETPMSMKLARLFLVSDILHNSSVHVPNAWKYRMGFESRLPAVFEHLNEIYRSINARLKAEQVRRHISSVLAVWENWMVFPKYYIEKLNMMFMKKSANQDDHIQATESEGVHMSSEDTEELPTEAVEEEYEHADDDGVDGEPMEADDVDGEVLEDVDGEPLEDIDGMPFEEEEDSPVEEQNERKEGETAINLEDIQDMFATMDPIQLERALRELPPDTLLTEIPVVQNSISHLRQSNTEMHEFDPEEKDLDLVTAIRENEGLIKRYEARIDLTLSIIRERIGEAAAEEVKSNVVEFRRQYEAASEGENMEEDGVFL
ncbi:U2 snRNP-associated SURP domain-containing protein [Apophysomyces sp. BC1015]|nr:U2 snRNP-associated SURP domain-containing protein [Apophysomyces sp. BC1015]KAG0178890.1 U2 snRNP-associated SURP domain-containing protein [Apophysomyces sp. BC1021]